MALGNRRLQKWWDTFFNIDKRKIRKTITTVD